MDTKEINVDTNVQKKRNISLDLLKVFCTFLVVWKRYVGLYKW